MRTTAFALAAFAAILLAVPSAHSAEFNDICGSEYSFPEGFHIAAFGMTPRHIQQFWSCGLANLGEEDGVYQAAGKLDKVDVIFSFSVTPRAKKLFQVQMETFSSDLYNSLRSDFIKQLGQPKKDSKGRDTWEDSKSGGVLKLYRDRGFVVRMSNESYLLEEGMSYYCDESYTLPAGLGAFQFGAPIMDTLKAIGCDSQFVSRESRRLTAKAFAFNQPATLHLDFSSGDTLESLEYVIADIDAYPLIENVMQKKFGTPASNTSSSVLWQVDGGVQVMLSKGASDIRVKYVGPIQQ